MRPQTDGVWLNGFLTSRSAARIDPLSQGFLFGAGVYDTLLLRQGHPVALERHLARLANGAARLGLSAPPAETVLTAIHELSAALSLTDGRLRITLASGPSPNVQPGAIEEQIILITLTPLTPTKPAAAITLTPFRRNEHSPLAGIKYTACTENLIAQREAIAAGFDEGVFLNTAGQLCEGSFSNVFLVAGGKVLTPPLNSGCLPGVTREVLLELCQVHNIPSAETALSTADLTHADEVFLTSSIRGVQPVHRLDARNLEAPGPLTLRLRDLYAAWLVQQV